MSNHPHEGTPEGSILNDISPSKGKFSPRTSISSSDPLNVPPPSTSANVCPPGLVCPVPNCPFAVNGETPHRYLKRHLNHPGLRGRKGQDKEDWLNLHRIEHERLLATLAENKTEEERNSRTAEFELRARNMGIVEERFIAQKVAIWEGMWAAYTGYYAGVLLDAATSAHQ